MSLRSRKFPFLALLGVIALGPVVVYGALDLWWGRYSFHTDEAQASLLRSQRKEGFFSLRYQAYRERHNFGGTLNQVSIQNLSQEPLTVESLALEQVFRGGQVGSADAPTVYLGRDGSLVTGSEPIARRPLAPGETMTFELPTVRIWACAEGEKLQAALTIALRAGAQRYERTIPFTKTLTKTRHTP
ncbi:MAG TPA: hypothetical protein VGE76_02310 [Opitutaceae bacterium]